MGSPMEIILSLLQAEFDPYMEVWMQAKEYNIPFSKLYFSKITDGVYELVVPIE